jgi:PadR family transcriptional regulator
MKPEGFLPLTQTTYYILASLADSPKHGYAINQDVEWRSEGTVRLGIGNTYVALKRLLTQGLIERLGDLGETSSSERRKVYRLAGLGEAVLRAEAQRQRRMLAALPLAEREWA